MGVQTFRRLSGQLVFFATVALLPSILVAQDTGSIVGTVSDSTSGAPLAAVLLTLSLPEGEAVRSALTGPAGTFRIDALPPGEYDIQASLPGWEPLASPIVSVTGGGAARARITMVERPYRLNPLTVSVSRAGEKVLDAPAAVQIVSLEDMQRQPALTTVEHIRDQAAVDFVQTGLQGSYVVVRGFNNVFSGATLTLTDNRIARLPSLRANISYFNPINSLDLDRTDVVLGPSSALYGPNVEQGVIHSFTRPPIDDPGISISVASGIRQQPAVPEQGLEASSEGVTHVEGRVGFRASEALGFKVSGQYFSAADYRYRDAEEQHQQQMALACLEGGSDITDPNCLNFADGLETSDPADRAELERRISNVAGGRDEDLERWTLDARLDWRPNLHTSLVLAGGRATAVNSVDLTGLGSAQIVDWAYDYVQARLQWRDLFAQVFVNRNANDGSYLLRSGKTLVDNSRLLVAQLQHVSRVGDRNRLVYGLDFLRTVPVTDSTINGRNEHDDDVNELGGYMQWESALTRQLDMVLAARVDKNSRLADPVFSPRAALVYRPKPGHSLRLTFNRSFSTPNTISLFLDLSGGTLPLGGPFRYDVRAQGGTDTGFTFPRSGGVPMHLSPFADLIGSTTREYLPSSAPVLWSEGVAVAQVLAAAGDIDPDLALLLTELTPPDDSQVSVVALSLNPDGAEDEPPFVPFPGGLEGVRDLPPLEAGITNTLEAGYKGLLDERLLVGASGWYSHVSNRISALRVISPNVFLDGTSLNSYLAEEFLARVGTDFPDDETALAAAAAVSSAMAEVPLGVVAPEQAGGTTAPVVLTDRNLGSFDLLGVDLSLAWYLTGSWSLEGTASWVSDNVFVAGDGPEAEVVPLNAPGFKGSVAVAYGDPAGGFHATARARGIRGFPASSGVFAGQVEDYGVVDLTMGYRFRRSGLWLQLGIQNVLDTDYSAFPGAPTLGRMTLLRLRYDTPRVLE
jgi:outer membrane receptor for ferrienterochelin and colicins